MKSLITSQAYGYAKFPDEQCTTETIFDLASVSKCTTAAAAALLVDDANHPDVQWQTPVSKLIPSDFILPTQSLTDQVTLEDILSHRSGIATHDESYLGATAAHPDDARSLTRNLRHLAFTSPLRTRLQYSNIMFTAATHAVESISGEADYTAFLRSRIWDPLGMRDTFQDRPDVRPGASEAQGYRWDEDAGRHVAVPMLASPEGRGAGCVLSSAGDYAKFVRCLIQRAAPLSEKAHKALVEPRTIEEVPDAELIPGHSDVVLYALGLYRDTYRGSTLMTHAGAVPGFKAAMAYLPAKEWGLVICTNSNLGTYVNGILKHMLMDEVLGVRGEEREDWEKVFRERRAKYVEGVRKEKEKPEYKVPESPEPFGVAIEGLVGRYFNKGYKEIRLEMKKGKVVADCSDRCFPFVMTFEHLSANKFVADTHEVWDAYDLKRKAEVRVNEEGKVVAVGIEFVDDMEDFVWFEKIES